MCNNILVKLSYIISTEYGAKWNKTFKETKSELFNELYILNRSLAILWYPICHASEFNNNIIRDYIFRN